MADKKITQLPPAAGVTADDLIPIVDDPGGAPVTQKATAAQLAAFIYSATIQVYEGRAPAPPDDPTRPALNYPTGGGSLEQWSVGAGAWV